MFIFFVGAAVLATWPLARHLTSRVFSWGDPLETTWIFGWEAYGLRENAFGLIDGSIFNANVFHPEPLTLAYTESFLGLSIPVAPLVWLTSNPLLAYNLVTIGLFAACGYATYLLVRQLTHYRPAGVVAGLAFAFAPYRMSQIVHMHVLAVHLMPIVLLMLLRLRRDSSWRVVAAIGLVFGLQIWSSFTGAAMTVLVVGVWGLWELACGSKAALPLLGRAGVAMALGLALSIPVIKPYLDLRKIHPEFKHPGGAVLDLSAIPTSYLVPPEGNALFRSPYKALARRYVDARGDWETSLFPGFVLTGSFALAIGAIVRGGRGRSENSDNPEDPAAGSGTTTTDTAETATSTYTYLWLFLRIAAVGFVISLGPKLGATADGMKLPFVVIMKLGFTNFARVPARFGMLVPFAMAVVVGLAIEAARPPWRRRLATTSLALLTIELLLPTLRPITAPVITAAHRSISNIDGVALGLPTVEIHPDGSVNTTTIPINAIHLYLSTAHYRPIVNGYGTFQPSSFWNLMRAVQDFPNAPGMQMLHDRGVTTVIVQTDLVRGTRWDDVVKRLDDWPGALLVARDRGVRVYDISNATDAAPRPAEAQADLPVS